MFVTGLDFRLAARRLCRAPAFATAAVVLLAISIAGTTFVFSIVRGLLLQAIPYEQPERLVVLSPKGAIGGNLFEELRQQRGVFEDVGAYTERAVNLSGQGSAERVLIARVTSSFLPLTGVQPALGRLFGEEDFRTGREPAALITDRLWRRRYGAARDVVGRVVTLDRRPHTIVGVLPPSFKTIREMERARELPLDRNVEALVPLPGNPHTHDRTGSDRVFRGVTMLGRLRQNVTIDQASQGVAPILAREQRRIGPLVSTASGNSIWRPAFVLQPLASAVAGELPAQLAMLSTAVVLLLVVGCANVMNLVLGRIEIRRREVAVSAAIGASRRHIVGSILAETLLVSSAGGALGLLVATQAAAAMHLLAGGMLNVEGVAIDMSVLAFTATLSIGTGVLVGLGPALRHARTDPAAALQAQPSAPRTVGRLPLASTLVVIQVALAVVLVVGGTLLARTFVQTVSVNSGFATDGILTAEVALDRAAFRRHDGVTSYFTGLLDRVAALPGIEGAALVSVTPGGEFDSGMPVRVHGRAQFVDAVSVSPDYFRVLSIPVLAGSVRRDGDTSIPAVVVNEAFAWEHLDGPADAVGQRITLVAPSPRTSTGEVVREPELSVVAVVADSRDNASASAPRPKMYLSYKQLSSTTTMTILVRTSMGHPAALAPPLVRLMREFDPDQPLYNVLPLEAIIRSRFARERTMAAVMDTFAILALLVAAIGVYAAMSYAGALRRHEVGVRLALGGTRASVLCSLAWRGIKLVGTGLELGILLGVASAPVLRNQLFGTDGLDIPTTAGAVVLVTVVSAIALLVPAWRATRVDPMTTLRAE